ncbi:MAG: hypothetical protein QOD75_3591 [Blastocatellia bacterium]|jgi:hypothetical protein|nr:hypothetical protein [Blastocatellia bacterium]
MPNFQILNVNYPLYRKTFKIPIVCDISPNIAIQVVTVDGLNENELLSSVRALTAWDMSNAISQRQIEKGTK